MLFNPEIFHTCVRDAPDRTHQTIKAIARRMGGVSEKYLAKQLNPDDCTSKLGVDDFVYYLMVTDLKPLDYLEEVFGRVAVAIPEGPAERTDWLHHISSVTKEAGDAVSRLAAALADGKVTDRERLECGREVWEAIQALAELWRRLGDEGESENAPVD